MMYRFDFKARTRSDAQGGADLVRYLRREGEFAPPSQHERDVAYLTRQSGDTVEHDDLRGEPLVGNLPAWAEGSAATYFATALANETRKGAQYAIALQIALPRVLNHEQHVQLAQDFVEATLPHNPYLLVKHEPVNNGERQPHLHILVGPRVEDGIERSPAQHFRRYNPDHPERGGAQKDRFWNQRQAPRQLRTAFADLANYHLERAGVEERVDPRSLAKQDITRPRIEWKRGVPGTLTHPLPSEAERAREQRKAAAAWEQRKAYKEMGDVRTISREEMVMLARQHVRQYDIGHALPSAAQADIATWESRQRDRHRAQVLVVERRITDLEAYAARLDAQTSPRDIRGTVGLLAEAERLGLGEAACTDGIQHGRTRLHLFEEEYSYGR